MAEVRRHQRQTASGKVTTVRQHHRDTGAGGPPPGSWYFRNHGDGLIYEVHPDGSARPLPAETVERPPPPQASAVAPAMPGRGGESWWDDGEAPIRDYTLSDEDAPGPWAEDVPLSPERPRGRAFERMAQEMRDRRALGQPGVPPAVPDTSPLGRALGTDTQEGADRFAQLKAHRESGYDGPLDRDGNIPDPDDPANWAALSALADMRECRG